MLQRLGGDPAWADRCEEIAFNSLPVTTAENHRALHYITSANSVELADTRKTLGQFAYGPFPMQAYEPSPHNYRCCTHHYGMGWPYFTESLWLATADGGLCAAMYAPSEVKVKVAGGAEVKIVEETEYPFADTLTLRIDAPNPVTFPLYLRLPGWADAAEIKINGKAVAFKPQSGAYVRLDQQWKPGDVITLRLPMSVRVEHWPANRDAVSVAYGPLDFSLDIKERPVPYTPEKYDEPDWGGTQLYADSPWNYGLVVPASNAVLKVERRPGPLADDPFTHAGNPLTIRAAARRLPQWTADADGVVGPLQPSPARSAAPVETVTLNPAGATRLRITSFPTVSPEGHPWRPRVSGVSTYWFADHGRPHGGRAVPGPRRLSTASIVVGAIPRRHGLEARRGDRRVRR